MSEKEKTICKNLEKALSSIPEAKISSVSPKAWMQPRRSRKRRNLLLNNNQPSQTRKEKKQ